LYSKTPGNLNIAMLHGDFFVGRVGNYLKILEKIGFDEKK